MEWMPGRGALLPRHERFSSGSLTRLNPTRSSSGSWPGWITTFQSRQVRKGRQLCKKQFAEAGG